MPRPEQPLSVDGAGAMPAAPGAGMLGTPDEVDGTDLVALRRKVDQLNAALESRTTIGVAIGILVAYYRVSPERGFELLVRWSQHRNIKLRAIAETLVAVAVSGPAAPGVDRALARWLSEQLSGTPLSARADFLRSRPEQDGPDPAQH